MVPYEILSPKAEKMRIIGPASDGRSYGRAELSGTTSGFSKGAFSIDDDDPARHHSIKEGEIATRKITYVRLFGAARN